MEPTHPPSTPGPWTPGTHPYTCLCLCKAPRPTTLCIRNDAGVAPEPQSDTLSVHCLLEAAWLAALALTLALPG